MSHASGTMEIINQDGKEFKYKVDTINLHMRVEDEKFIFTYKLDTELTVDKSRIDNDKLGVGR